MQTILADTIRDTAAGQEADRILRTCVHCGFCNATCPTYQLLGDELDGPRGRIYQIKQMLEGAAVTRTTLTHLDRCLTCRNCESTCPSGVHYGRLLDTGRELVEQRVGRPTFQSLMRWLIRSIVPYPARFLPLLRTGQLLRPLLPTALRRRIPARLPAQSWPTARHTRRMLVLEGCVQSALAPQINAATARVLDRLGISLMVAEGAGCCGAASFHTSGHTEAHDFARRNIDAWWPHIEAGIEAIVMTASGCGVHVKDYGHLLRDDPAYAGKAARVATLTRDLGEVLAREDLAVLRPTTPPGQRIAFQAPCTLQHGQKLGGVVEGLLRDLGFTLVPVVESHLCCGSAGTYSILQRDLSQQLRRRKLGHLEADRPELIATANIGCLAHLASHATVPVRHWIELL
jgi:glycolate oxidase iron-sulfur subunit